nr:MAG TPA: hypothetical protein [Caudoviricetes sp.]
MTLCQSEPDDAEKARADHKFINTIYSVSK